jgi:8-oxo-dGTP pyrophosphatase MutT (NUDIX family)
MIWTAESLRRAITLFRRNVDRVSIEREGLIPSAVLVPLVASADGTQLLLTRRTDTVETHKGHVAFPGGMADEDDRDRVATALRETREEIGIAADTIEVIDMLDDLATPTGFVITPVVGYIAAMPPVHPNPAEVAEVFLVPFAFLEDPANCRREIRSTDYGPRETWQYIYDDRVIWGATAGIIHRMMDMLFATSATHRH